MHVCVSVSVCVYSFSKVLQDSQKQSLQVIHLQREAQRALFHTWLPVLCFYAEREWEAALRDKQSKVKAAFHWGRVWEAENTCVDGLSIKPTRHRVRRHSVSKCCSQMDGRSQIYFLWRSFLADYATVSQHEVNSLALSVASLPCSRWIRCGSERGHCPLDDLIWNLEQISKAYITGSGMLQSWQNKGGRWMVAVL